jgi:hypothetical protein
VHGPKIFKTKAIRFETAEGVESLLEIVKSPLATGKNVCIRSFLAEA